MRDPICRTKVRDPSPNHAGVELSRVSGLTLPPLPTPTATSLPSPPSPTSTRWTRVKVVLVVVEEVVSVVTAVLVSTCCTALDSIPSRVVVGVFVGEAVGWTDGARVGDSVGAVVGLGVVHTPSGVSVWVNAAWFPQSSLTTYRRVVTPLLCRTLASSASELNCASRSTAAVGVIQSSTHAKTQVASGMNERQKRRDVMGKAR